ncbi:MAG: DinB family protein [Acidobacteria bacterium]|nr:DinB family protein [Acidobacteriota bacterium]
MELQDEISQHFRYFRDDRKDAAQVRTEPSRADAGSGEFPPSPDRWTIAENAEHVTIVNGGFVRLTNKMLKQAEAESRPALSDLQMPPLTLTDEGEMKPGKWQAPDMVKPKGGIGVEQSIAGNRQIIDELFALKSRIDAVDLSDKKWNHPRRNPGQMPSLQFF